MTSTAINVNKTTTSGRAYIRSMLNEWLEDRAHDPWGCALHALSIVCDTLRASEKGAPSSIATHGARGLIRAIDAGKCTTDDVRYGMWVINRYADLVERAGRSY